MRCFADKNPLIASVARSQVNASTTEDFARLVRSVVSDADCVSSHNLGVADWDKSNQVTLQGTQRNTFANTGSCFNSSAYGSDSTVNILMHTQAP